MYARRYCNTEYTRIVLFAKQGKADWYCHEAVMALEVVVLCEGFVFANVIHQMCGNYHVALSGERSKVQSKKSEGKSTDMVGE